MKKNILALIIFTSLFSYSQENSVSKNIKGLQLGIYGIWAYNETKLVENLVLRNEIGIDVSFGKNFLIANPSITFEPKWYYNANKRKRKGKNIKNNSANFLSIQAKYYFNNFISNNIDREDLNQNKILKTNLTWGIRRSISETLNYETGIGLGIQRDFIEDQFEPSLNIHLRFGLGW